MDTISNLFRFASAQSKAPFTMNISHLLSNIHCKEGSVIYTNLKMIHRLTKSNDICGINAITTAVRIKTMINGNAPFMTCVSDSPVIPCATNRFNPNGGVIIPIDNVTIIMIPKCMGSIPSS